MQRDSSRNLAFSNRTSDNAAVTFPLPSHRTRIHSISRRLTTRYVAFVMSS